MAQPFFGRRDNEPSGLRPGNPNVASSMSTPASSPVTTSSSSGSGGSSSSAAPSTSSREGGSKLTVGPNIKLKGVEITDCDTLVVEGMVEATMDSRVIQIAENGAFKGSAEIDIAEIHGVFDGSLTVRQKLVIYSTGKVTGKIRYGKVVIEEGGQLSGDIEFSPAGGAQQQRALPPGGKSGLHVAA